MTALAWCPHCERPVRPADDADKLLRELMEAESDLCDAARGDDRPDEAYRCFLRVERLRAKIRRLEKAPRS